MLSSKAIKASVLFGTALFLFCIGAAAFASATSGVGIGAVAKNVSSNLGNIAKLITAGSYVAGMGFGVGAIVKFKAHKDAPTQTALSVPIALLFVAAALMFIPSVFSSAGKTLYGTSGSVAGISGTMNIQS